MFSVNQIIGRHYKILTQLGEGGMGQVFKALDMNLGREVAIKFLLAEIAQEEEIVKRFLNEGRTLATINHPAVITVYASDVEQKSGVPFLVMEFVDGKSLDAYKAELKEDPITLVKHFIQLLSGIYACHQKNIIHRDLKPENVLINKDGQLKLVDFGIAKTATKQTRTGIAIGTPHYMSPEQCLGKHEIDNKTDVYAAGIMLYEILCGQLPYRLEGQASDPALSIALMHLNSKPDLDKFNDVQMGDKFRALVERMIAKKAKDRPDVPEILEELKTILNRFKSSQPGAEPQNISERKTIGEIYELQEEIGSGGMGKVYKALDTALNRTVAIKVLHQSTSSNYELVDRFIKEGQTLATVGHRNVMGIYASSCDKKSGQTFLVMEYIEGKSLSKLKDAVARDQRQSVPIMLQLAEGIAACHDKNIIHRDLKPSNIIITPAGLVKIIDFGIAKTETSITKTGMTMGTPEYMSPEQCTGSKNITGKSDIYSLGIIFWELVFGTVPYKADTNDNPELCIALKHIEATLPVQAAIPDLSLVPILGLVRRMLDKSPDARPDPDEIIETLEEYLLEHMPEAAPRSVTGRRTASSSRSSSLSGLHHVQPQKSRLKPAIIVAALVIIAFVAIWQSGIFQTPDYDAMYRQAREQIDGGNFDQAIETFRGFPDTTDGRDQKAALEEHLAQTMINMADKAEEEKDLEQAIELYAKSVALDPSNPRTARTLARLQNEHQRNVQRQNKLDELNSRALALLTSLEPDSGPKELDEIMKELIELDMGTDAEEIAQTWQASFINRGEAVINTNPQTSLAFFNNLKEYFPKLDGIDELIARADTQYELLKDQLAQTTMVTSVKEAVEAAIANYAPGQKHDFVLKQLERLRELEETAMATELGSRLASKMVAEADKLIASKPSQAIAILLAAQPISPETPAIEIKLKLAHESLKALKDSEEEKAEKERARLEALKKAEEEKAAKERARLEALEKAEEEKAAKARELELELARQRKIINDKIARLDKFAANPDPAKANEILSDIAEISKLSQDFDSKAQVKKMVNTMNSALGRASSLSDAKSILDTMPIIDKSAKINVTAELHKLADQKTSRATSFIRNFKPSNNITPALEQLSIFDQWNQSAAKNSLINQLKNSYITQANNIAANSAENALKLIQQLYRLPGLQNDPEIKALEQQLVELDKQHKTPKIDPRVVKAIEDAKFIAGRPMGATEAQRLLAAIDIIEASPQRSEAPQFRQAGATKILDSAQSLIKSEKLDEAEKLVILARQLAPDDMRATAVQVEITRARAAIPKELVVGRGQTYSTITQAVRDANDGAVIRVMPGNYSENLVIDGNITIVGDSASTCKLNSSSGSLITIRGNAKISGLGLSLSSRSAAATILISSGNPTISECIISNATPANAPNFVAAIEVDAGQAIIANNQINGSKGMGIIVRGGSPTIRGNQITNSTVYGAWFTGAGSRPLFVENNVFSNSKSGVGVKDGAAPKVLSNRIEKNGENGIFIYSDAKGEYENNILHENGHSGIEVWDAQPTTISANQINSNRRDGIYVRGGKARAQLKQNQFNANRGKNVKNAGGRVTEL